ncbi:unnamed protein product [Cuscuta campestris]|uniref:Thioredoxin domain-containing protein n=1 Tax=Cuscuta campestris TaxID=132261 RepID=A0A484KRJ7_9ASTE|nr:unnamed protein product [Cuscuta campestris]
MASSCATHPSSLPLPQTPLCRRSRRSPPFNFQQKVNLNFGTSPLNRSLRSLPASRLRVSCLRASKAAVVTGKSWDKLVLTSDTPVLVEFYASWCGPCQMVHRVVDEIAAEYSGRIKCFVLHADTDVQIAENYDIKAVPVVLLFKNGQKFDSIIGTMPKEFYVAAIERLLPGTVGY